MPDDRKLLAALSPPGLLPSLEKDLGPYADGIYERRKHSHLLTKVLLPLQAPRLRLLQ